VRASPAGLLFRAFFVHRITTINDDNARADVIITIVATLSTRTALLPCHAGSVVYSFVIVSREFCSPPTSSPTNDNRILTRDSGRRCRDVTVVVRSRIRSSVGTAAAAATIYVKKKKKFPFPFPSFPPVGRANAHTKESTTRAPKTRP
jgi:hypothetical protein